MFERVEHLGEHRRDLFGAPGGVDGPCAREVDQRPHRVVLHDVAQAGELGLRFVAASDVLQAQTGVAAGKRGVALAARLGIAVGGAPHRLVQLIEVEGRECGQPTQEMQIGPAPEFSSGKECQHLFDRGPAAGGKQCRTPLDERPGRFVPGAGAHQPTEGSRQIAFAVGGAPQQLRQFVGMVALQPVFEEIAKQVMKPQGEFVGFEHADEKTAPLDLLEQPHRNL